MFVDRQRIDLLNRLIDARVDLAAYVQLRKAKGYMSRQRKQSSTR